VKNKNLLILQFFCLTIVTTVSAQTLLLDDFNGCSPRNALKSNNGIWCINPDDKTQGCIASFEERSSGDYCLKLEYDIDSAFDYIYQPAYISDYSEFNIIGYAENGIPHRAFNGFYFLLDGIDLSEFKYICLDIKGDETHGYTRRFQIELKTLDQQSSFIIDGITNKWKTFVIPLNSFKNIDNWKAIYELTIVFNEIATSKEGVIYLDNICFSDRQPKMTHTENQEPEERRWSTAKAKNFTAKTSLGIALTYDNEYKTQFFHSGNLIFEGTRGKLGGRMKISFTGQEFGQSAWLNDIDEYPYQEFLSENPQIQLPTIQFNINGISPMLSNITLGNIWIGYSPDIVSPFWGWKGIKICGRRGNFEHATFFIKRIFDSYSLGQRGLYYFGNHRMKYVLLYHHETATLAGSEEKNGLLESKSWVKPISNELDYEGSLLFRFFNYRVNFELLYGKYNLEKFAEADYTNPQSPVFNYELEPNQRKDDYFYKGNFLLDGLWRGQKFLYSYRRYGSDFTPRYRQQPIVYEDVIGDQIGHNFRTEQWYKGRYIKLYLDKIRRLTNSSFYRNVFEYEIGITGRKEFELTVTKKIRNEKYERTEYEISKNERVSTTEINGKYNFIYSRNPGYRFPLEIDFAIGEDRVKQKIWNVSYRVHRMEVKIAYNLGDISLGLNFESSSSSNSNYSESEIEISSYFNINF